MSITDRTTNDFLTRLTRRRAWIGASQNAWGSWMWSDGTPWCYQNWLPGEPNSIRAAGRKEMHVEINHPRGLGKWNDDLRAHGYICQK